MIGTEFIKGQGLGNQLFAYVTARSIAEDKGVSFGTAGQDRMGVNIHSNRGMYFMDIDMGVNIPDEDISKYKRYEEREVRLFAPNSKHDIEHGVYVAGADGGLKDIDDNTLIYGNLQDESYFLHHIDDLRNWLKVKEEYDSYEYSADDLCIMNMRGGEYTDSPELYIGKRYWTNAMDAMKKINPGMRFMIITDDVKAANRMFPNIEAHHFDVGEDYVTIKNAKYLILSNSSFAVMAAYTSDTLKYALAPKYWARFNVSDGYWASEQNIYSKFDYMDCRGNIITADECRDELHRYKSTGKYLKRTDFKPEGTVKSVMLCEAKLKYMKYKASRLVKKVIRKLT